MQTYTRGPVEYVGSRFKRSIPQNLTSVRSRNKTKDMALQRGKASVLFGKQRTRTRKVDWVDREFYRECKTRNVALALAKLFLEPEVLKWRGKYWVKMV